MSQNRIRCNWANNTPNMMEYHDTEYGFPVHDNNQIFERLMLEIYQAGLSWQLVINKREAFNSVFHNYVIEKVAAIQPEYIDKIVTNPDIIRNRMKLNATVHNAQLCQLKIMEYGDLISYFSQLPHQQENLKLCVKLMKKDGFKFIGQMILEEFFMSIGLNKVNHAKECFLYIP